MAGQTYQYNVNSKKWIQTDIKQINCKDFCPLIQPVATKVVDQATV